MLKRKGLFRVQPGYVENIGFVRWRLREAAKHGFKKAIIPSANAPKSQLGELDICRVQRLEEAVDYFKNVSSTPSH